MVDEPGGVDSARADAAQPRSICLPRSQLILAKVWFAIWTGVGVGMGVAAARVHPFLLLPLGLIVGFGWLMLTRMIMTGVYLHGDALRVTNAFRTYTLSRSEIDHFAESDAIGAASTLAIRLVDGRSIEPDVAMNRLGPTKAYVQRRRAWLALLNRWLEGCVRER